MQLTKETMCSNIEISTPRWKQRVVGIANFRVGEHNAINITGTNKLGKRYYPDAMYGSGEMIRQCPTQILPSGIKLYLVPLANLEKLERI